MFHRQTPRAQRYDYTSWGGYFITICTAGRQHYFGDVCCRDDTSGRPPYMQLNDLWNIVDQYILSIPDHFPHVEIHEYVVMPNHVHILLLLSELPECRDAKMWNESPWDTARPLFNRNEIIARPLSDNLSIHPNEIQRTARDAVPTTKPLPIWPQYWSLGYIINQFKWWCTREINKQSAEWKLQIPYWDTFARQPRYHDHIIRNEDSYNKIKHYIQTNPQNRENDSFNK